MVSAKSMSTSEVGKYTGLTTAQNAVIVTLYDVYMDNDQNGGIILKNKYHSAAAALIRRGYAKKIDRGFYRPLYEITESGVKFMRELFDEW